MAPGKYTELFFLDEATALAAGHRPCATCRREAYGTFKELWTAANPQLAGRTDGSINAIDRQLHAERVDANGRKRTWSAVLGGLPDGVVVALAQDAEPLLVRRGYLHPWLPGGYGSPLNADPQTRVLVLTPLSLSRMLAHGYVPQLHPSIESGRIAQSRPIPSLAPAPAQSVALREQPPTSPIRREEQASDQRAVHATGVVPPVHQRLYRLAETPRGNELYTYFAAILSVTGMDAGAAYPLNKFLGNFAGHIKAGRIERAPGGHRLTQQGKAYFADRYHSGSPQRVHRSQVEAVARLIRSGGAAGWVPVD